jgi:NhaP-type Na+/H+ or K+/H+ antiporter
MIYLGMGALGATGVALLDAPWLAVVDDASVIEHISEGAVVVALFATGLRLDHALTLREWRSTVLLLGVVMPITIAGVTLLGVWVAGLSIGGAIVLAAALAPTDPVLAGDLGVLAPGEGDRSEAAFALTSEAGLNDGLAFPFVFLGLVVASGGGAAAYAEWFTADVLYAVGAGIGIGAFVGWGIAAAAVRLRDRGLLSAGLDGWAAGRGRAGDLRDRRDRRGLRVPGGLRGRDRLSAVRAGPRVQRRRPRRRRGARARSRADHDPPPRQSPDARRTRRGGAGRRW